MNFRPTSEFQYGKTSTLNLKPALKRIINLRGGGCLDMKLSPLKDYRGARYPTQEILQQHPELLRALPRRWQNNPLVLGTLAGLLALMEQSCATRMEPKDTLRVAPIFSHGKGCGPGDSDLFRAAKQKAVAGMFGYGFFMTETEAREMIQQAERSFLTETEARQIIEQESLKFGVELAGRGHKLSGAGMPPFKRRPLFCSGKKSPQKADLELSGWNGGLKVGYKFVSKHDFINWEAEALGETYDPPGYNMRKVAERMRNKLGKVQEPGFVAVFYDPVGSSSDKLKISHTNASSPKECLTLSREEEHLLFTVQKGSLGGFANSAVTGIVRLLMGKTNEYQGHSPHFPLLRNGKPMSPEEKQAWEKVEQIEEAKKKHAKEAGEERLRAQVRDFLVWLKAQGVL